jgi:cell division protease FtsH
MTNKMAMIDSAISRRGRFDHVITVDYASAGEVKALLASLTSSIPTEADVDLDMLSEMLAGRPLSDVSYVIREGAGIAARQRHSSLTLDTLLMALKRAPARNSSRNNQRMGFV